MVEFVSVEMTEPARARDRNAGQAVPSSLILVADADLEAARKLALPVALCVGGAEGFVLEGRGVPADLVHGAALGVLVLSRAGAAAVEAMAAGWLARFGVSLPDRLDLSEERAGARREAALSWIADVLLAQRQGAARRAVALMRDMAALRREHEAMQAAFARLEAHAFHHRLSERKLLMALAPVEGSPVAELPSGAEMVQRLPGGSVGLSDLAVRIAEVPQPRQGVLTCRLESPDLGRELAEWTLPAAQLSSGWLRLSLVRGLEEDPVGLQLRLGWSGAVPLRLATAMAHPDPRFRPQTGGGTPVGRHVLAMEIWHYLPGVRAPASATGRLPDGEMEAGPGMRRLEARDLLRAINLDTLARDMTPVQGGGALLVHVMPEQVACAILPLPLAGPRQVSVDVMTRNAKGPVVEYAIAVLPAAMRPKRPGALPDFPEEAHSGWVRMKPMRAGQVTLILPDLPAAEHDLYLMTRLPPGATSNAYGWSGFSSVVLHV
ncbi:hypothetical protein C0V75_19180 [Tabrizicola sp. TH137]|uniref:DUF6212 domain-containing protein n=1 Tax=Tabrizicola sp. TH137 TaxID=2067452 RepID=UPI000C7D1282|nr:DUF6212 domain-containing protein [Tabrizicola sp. TH137]PLL10812.1 hypothetical protein C0V75_19180 [Tabrizicola sp. TH137]